MCDGNVMHVFKVGIKSSSFNLQFKLCKLRNLTLTICTTGLKALATSVGGTFGCSKFFFESMICSQNKKMFNHTKRCHGCNNSLKPKN
jgi:hypothetical protein